MCNYRVRNQYASHPDGERIAELTEIPTITLNNGVVMPQLGFGVFQVPDAETTAAVRAALQAGYQIGRAHV